MARYEAPWQQTRDAGVAYLPVNPISGNRYKGINAILLAAEATAKGFGDTRWLTEGQAEKQGGVLHVNQAPASILFWQFKETVDGREVALEKPRLRLAAVYNAEQFYGLPEQSIAVSSPPSLATMLENAGVSHIRNRGSGPPRYDSVSDIIAFRQDADPQQQARDIAHQLAHWTGHPSRMDRSTISDPPGSTGHAREELRTNIASWLMGSDFQIGNDGSDHASLAGPWRELIIANPAEILGAAVVAERIVSDVLDLTRERIRSEITQEQMQAMARQVVQLEQEHPALAPAATRTYLAVPFADRQAVKAAGARWDGDAKAWYAPPGADITPLSTWLPDKSRINIASPSDPIQSFLAAATAAGLNINGAPVINQLTRVPVAGDTAGERSGAYKLHMDGVPAGYIENFKTGERTNWKAGTVARLDAAAKAHLIAAAAQDRINRAAEIEAKQTEVAAEVAIVWREALLPDNLQGRHPYMDKKQVIGIEARIAAADQRMIYTDGDGKPHNDGIGGRLLVPVKNHQGQLMSLQWIDDKDRKGFWPGGKVQGGYCMVGNEIGKAWPVIVCEGYATACTLHELSGLPVAAAFSANNLAAVAQGFREQNPERTIYVAGDNDHTKEGTIGRNGLPRKNVGRDRAIAAADLVGGVALIPRFDRQKDAGLSDWNDLARADLSRAIAQLNAGMTVGRARAERAAGQSRERVPEPVQREALSRGR